MTLLADKPVLKAPPLKPGDTIAIVAPAYPLDRRQERVDLVEQRLTNMGFKVKRSPNIFERRGYVAGSDEDRAKYFMEAWLDPEVTAIFPGTGGYGTTRMLDRLDFDAIAAHPKILIGFSDITALHLAINKATGLVTFHSPNPLYGLGSEDGMHPYSREHFFRAIVRSEYFDKNGDRLDEGWTFDLDDVTTKPVTVVPGVARGRLIGGNLSLVAALMGTPWEIETEGKILFLEDVGEQPYRVDRMLSNLRLAGKLDKPAGVILGVFRNCVSEKPEYSLDLDTVFDDYFGEAAYPVIKEFPIGHIYTNGTFPVGAMAGLDADAGEVTILEDPVDLEE